MNNFVKIGTGEPYKKELPETVSLPVFIDVPVPHSVEKVYSIEDKGWDEALFRFMFLNGYCFAEDNEREMK